MIQIDEPSTTYIPHQWPWPNPNSPSPNTNLSSFTYSYPQLSDSDVTRIATKMIEILESRGMKIVAARAEEV